MTVSGAVRFTVDEPMLRVERLEARADRRQGLVIDADNDITIEDVAASRVVLWADRAPHTIDIELDAPCEIRCWNVWDDDGLTQAWLGEAGVAIADADGDATGDDDDAPLLDAPLVLHCHDGHDDADDGADLVVRLSPAGG